MILYFSGTGNSEYAANRIGTKINDHRVNLFDKIRENDFSPMRSDTPWVIIVPTYAWRIPRIVQKWLENTPLTGNKKIYFVMTCGGSIGNAGMYHQKLCNKKAMQFCGCIGITLPENYIALFSTPTKENALKTIDQAENAIDRVAQQIQAGEHFHQPDISLGDKLNSGIINDLFYPAFVHAKKFYATDKCISCGKCVSVCPLENIHLDPLKPVWGKNCTHCMACICRCPTEAIEYGKHSSGLPRYTCPKKS
jgi:ferredoxin